MKPKTSCGISEISPKLVKSNNLLIAIPLSHIPNLSFQTGVFPRNMKIAKVIPIYKNKDNREVSKLQTTFLASNFFENY